MTEFQRKLKKKTAASAPVLLKVPTRQVSVTQLHARQARLAELAARVGAVPPQALFARSAPLQRAVAAPVLEATRLAHLDAGLRAQERFTLQRAAAELGHALPPDAVQAALAREAEARQRTPTAQPMPTARATPADLARAYAAERQALQDAAPAALGPAHGEIVRVQREAADALGNLYRRSTSPPVQRAQELADALARVQRAQDGRAVTHAVLQRLSGGERAIVQRAVDERSAALAEQDAQDRLALDLHAVQRQIGQLDAEGELPPLARLQARAGRGRPLGQSVPEDVRRQLELGLNTELAGVGVHTDDHADRLARDFGAKAFTSGGEVFFRRDTFDPHSRGGVELLGHELTHVVQQRAGRVGAGVDADPALEQEAREAGSRFASGSLAPQGPAFTPNARVVDSTSIQRQKLPGGGIEGLLQGIDQATKAQDFNKVADMLRKLTKDQQRQALGELMKRYGGRISGSFAEGIQAMLDGLEGKVPEAIRKIAGKGMKAGPWDLPKGSKKPVPFYIGEQAHRAIANYYIAAHMGQTVFTNHTPLSTIFGRKRNLLDKNEQLLKPDIVNLTTRHLYEIKPRSSAGLAIAEANLYLAAFQKANIPMQLGPMNDPGVIGVVPAPGGHYAFQAVAPGAIVYDYRKGDYQPRAVPVPVPNTAPKTQEDPDFLKRMEQITGLTGAALILYIVISEGSRLFPPRNLVPIP